MTDGKDFNQHVLDREKRRSELHARGLARTTNWLELEAEARDLGIGPLRFSVPETPAVENPLAEPYWPLGGAVAWVMSRSLEEVRFSWATKVSTPAGRLHFAGMIIDGIAGMRAREAEDALWRALASGLLSASAVSATGEIVQPQPHIWAHTKVGMKGNALVVDANSAAIVFSQVLIRRDDLLKVFPAPAHSPTRRGRPPGTSKYDWPAFLREAIRMLEHIGDFDAATDPSWTPAEMKRHMVKWAQKNWSGPDDPDEKNVPSRTAIQEKLKDALIAFRERRAGKVLDGH
jgi:hypothetical protein